MIPIVFTSSDLVGAPSLLTMVLVLTIQLASLNMPPLTNLEYVAHITPILPLFQNFQMDVHEIIVGIDGKKAVISATGSAETAVGPYCNEYIFVLSFNEKDDNVAKIVTFVDSHVSLSITEKMAAFHNLTQVPNAALIV